MTYFIDVALNHKKADRKKLFYLTYRGTHNQIISPEVRQSASL